MAKRKAKPKLTGLEKFWHWVKWCQNILFWVMVLYITWPFPWYALRWIFRWIYGRAGGSYSD